MVYTTDKHVKIGDGGSYCFANIERDIWWLSAARNIWVHLRGRRDLHPQPTHSFKWIKDPNSDVVDIFF